MGHHNLLLFGRIARGIRTLLLSIRSAGSTVGMMQQSAYQICFQYTYIPVRPHLREQKRQNTVNEAVPQEQYHVTLLALQSLIRLL